MGEQSSIPALMLHLSKDHVLCVQRSTDGFEITLVTRLAQYARIADHSITATASNSELLHDVISQCIGQLRGAGIASFIVKPDHCNNGSLSPDSRLHLEPR